eukprot:Hpha_TRINITY_DN1997_c0_g1::TRINITY_DN1997_c0_g1_i1::g.31122::m.31122
MSIVRCRTTGDVQCMLIPRLRPPTPLVCAQEPDSSADRKRETRFAKIERDAAESLMALHLRMRNRPHKGTERLRGAGVLYRRTPARLWQEVCFSQQGQQKGCR